MTNLRSIPLTRATGLGSLPSLFEARAGERALLKAFAAEGIPFSVTEALSTPIPLISMLGIFDRCARHLGDRTFGLEVGEMMNYSAFGLWMAHGVDAPTLGEAVRRLGATSWSHQSGCRVGIVDRGSHVVVHYRAHRSVGARAAHTDHIIAPTISIARSYLGRDWSPDWVEVNYPRDCDAALLEDRLQLPVVYGSDVVGIGLRREDLHRRRSERPVPPLRLVTLREVVADTVLADAPEPARTLSAIVAMRLLDGKSDIEGAARLAGLSVQGLQRRLREKGYTYREVLDAARQARAVALLRETELPIVSIALNVGYEDHASFTRAFHRWTGHSPSEARRQMALIKGRPPPFAHHANG